jgi:hypothetical protein
VLFVISLACSGILEAAHRLTRFSTALARCSIVLRVTLFELNACWRRLPRQREGAGISRSMPALIDSEEE